MLNLGACSPISRFSLSLSCLSLAGGRLSQRVGSTLLGTVASRPCTDAAAKILCPALSVADNSFATKVVPLINRLGEGPNAVRRAVAMSGCEAWLLSLNGAPVDK